MLAFSRRQTLISETLDLNGIAAGMEQMLRRTLGATSRSRCGWRRRCGRLWPTGRRSRARCESGHQCARCHAGRGKLTIETDNAHLDADYAANNPEVAPGDYVALAVTDTGTGMTPDVLAHAFEPFFTTKEVGKGTGLGLSMIYGFAKQSQGHAKIYSEVGHGTTVRLYLPRKTTAAESEAAPAGGDHERAGGSETILVVEDDADVRAFVTGQLSDLGLPRHRGRGRPARRNASSTASSRSTCCSPTSSCRRHDRPPTRRRRAGKATRLEAVFTSGYTENSIVHQGKLDKDVNFLSKPFRRQDLARKVRETLDG